MLTASSGGNSNTNNNHSVTSKNSSTSLRNNTSLKKVGSGSKIPSSAGGVHKNGNGPATTKTTTTAPKGKMMLQTSGRNRNAGSDDNKFRNGQTKTSNGRGKIDEQDDIDHDLGDLLHGDKGKRRTDRSDSSESSDSGVATLSPSASDSPELISSPYSPCDFSSEPSDSSGFCGSSRSSLGSSPSVSSSPPLLCDLVPDFDHHHTSNTTTNNNNNSGLTFAATTDTSSATTTGMTAVASVTLDPGPPPTHLNSVGANKAKVAVPNFISFQIPQTQPRLQSSTTSYSNPIKLLNDTNKNTTDNNNVQSSFNCDVRKFASASNIKNLIAALGYESRNGTTSTGGGGAAETAAGSTPMNCDGGENATGKTGGVQCVASGVDFKLGTIPAPAIRPTATFTEPAPNTKSYILNNDGYRSGKVIILSVASGLNGTNGTVMVPAISTTAPTTTNGTIEKNYVVRPYSPSSFASKVSNPPAILYPTLPTRKKPKPRPESESSSSPSTKATPKSFKKTEATTTALSPPNCLLSQPTSFTGSSSDISNSYRNYANPSALHLNGPKKTDHSIEAINNNNNNSSKINNNNHSTTTKANQPKRISLRNSDISNRLMHLPSKIKTPNSTTTTSSPVTTLAKIASTNNLSISTIIKPNGTASTYKSSSSLTSASSVVISHKPQNNSLQNSTTTTSCSSSSHSLLTNNNCISSKSNNSKNANNNIANNSTKIRKPVALSAATFSDSTSSSTCSSPSCCISLSYNDHDADIALLPDSIISSFSSSYSIKSLSGSTSTFSGKELSQSKPATIASISSSPKTPSSPSPSCSSSTSTIITTSRNNSDNANTKRESLLATSVAIEKPTEFCMWKDCKCIPDANLDFLEHIQTTHVAPQKKPEGYVCLWEGCKVYNKKSCSLSWLEHHVLTHGGNKPFRCIFAGCGLSFGTQGALERHVNSHIISNGNGTTANGNSSLAKKMDTTPNKVRRKKQRVLRNAKVNTGHLVDFFDKRAMEVIKYRLCSSAEVEDSIHNCTFKSQVLSRRISVNQEPHLFVRWYPEFILPDEWIPESQYRATKSVPFRQIPPDKMKTLFPHMFPPERKGKAQRKWKPSNNSSTNKCQHSEKMSTVKVEQNGCNCCAANNGSDSCTDLNSDWAEFLVQRYLS